MKSETFLGIDQGSSSTKAALIDHEGLVVGEWSAPVPQIERIERSAEQDPVGLLNSVRDMLTKGIAEAKSDGRPLRAWGLAVQRSGVLAWRAESGAIVHPMISWADTRTQLVVDSFQRGAEKISSMTGLPVLANFAAPKISLLQHRFLEPSTYVATLDTYLLHQLTRGALYTTEDTMAARTLLYDLHSRSWSDELCRQFKVDKRRLPQISPSLSTHATLDGAPLMAVLGDQQAALLGRFNAHSRALLNLGTIASLCKHTGQQALLKPGLKTTVLYSQALSNATGRSMNYMIESTSPVTGGVLLEPLRRNWCSSSQEMNALCEAAYSANPPGLAIAYWSNKEPLAPAWPHGVPNVTVCKPGASTADRVRAVVENVGNHIVKMLSEFSDKGLLGATESAEIDVAGGGSELDYLMQYVADVSGHTLHRLPTREAGARGAALAAWMSMYSQPNAHGFNTASPTKTFSCSNPERRKRFLMWQRMEQDVVRNQIPASAEVE
jgi:glycerol kinase